MAHGGPRDGPDTAEWIRRVHRVLQRAFRRAGRGTVQHVEKTLDIAGGTFRQWRRRGKLELGVLFQALEVLGVEPARFWVEVFGGELDPVQLARHPTGPPKDRVVRGALKRWERTEPDNSVEMTEKLLRELDRLRSDDPTLAVRRIKAALKTAEREWIPRLLAAYGTARRAEARIERALEALHYALLLAESNGCRVVCADILQRLGVAYAYDGNHSLGLLFAKQAAYEHQMAGNVRGEGRSLVDQGARYFHLGQLDHAGAAYKAALRSLPEDEIRHRFSAFLGLAVSRARRGRLPQAGYYANRAEEMASSVDRALVATLWATKAEIAIALRDYSEAERCYSSELEIFKICSPIDAALVSVELARTQYSRGRLRPAFDTIRNMSALLEPLKKNRIAGEAIRELLRIALSGERVTDSILDHVAREIERSRARRVGRARGSAYPLGSATGCKPA